MFETECVYLIVKTYFSEDFSSDESVKRRNYSSQTCIPRSFTSSSLTTTRLEMMIS